MSVAVRAPAQVHLRGLAQTVSGWLMKHLPEAIVTAVIGAAVGYVLNVYVMAFVYDGYTKTAGGPATGQGNLITGSLIYAVGSMLLFGLIGYRRAVGKERFRQEIRNLPVMLSGLFARDGQAARIHLLWGAGLSFIVALVVSPWLGAVLALGLFAALPSIIGAVFSGLLLRVWSTATSSVAPTKKSATGEVSMMVGMLGGCGALALSFFIVNTEAKLALAAICIVAAFFLANQGKPMSPMTGLLIFALLAVAGILLIDWLHPLAVLAHDGGRWESNDPDTWTWLNSPAAKPVLSYAGIGGTTTALGSPLGWGIGNVLGQMAPGAGGGPTGGAGPAGPAGPAGFAHPVLPPEQDPTRLTTYPDFPEWLRDLIKQARLRGGTIPPNVTELLRNNPGLTSLLPGGDPATWPDPPPDPTKVESNEAAINTLAAKWPGHTVTIGGTTYITPPGPLENWPPGVSGGGYRTIRVGTPPVEVIDPNSVAIARDWPHPNTPPTRTDIGGDAATIAAQLTALGFTPQWHDGHIVAPDNTPDNVNGIGFPTETINGVRVIKAGGPVIVYHW